jgi:hypothetical protein
MAIQTLCGRCLHKSGQSKTYGLKENNLQYLLLIIKFEISNENYNFRKLVSSTEAWQVSNTKDFFEVCSDNNNCEFSSFCTTKCVSIWKFYITAVGFFVFVFVCFFGQWHNVFQIIHHITKSGTGKRHIEVYVRSVSIGPMDFS